MNRNLTALLPMVALLACNSSGAPTSSSSPAAAGAANNPYVTIGGCLSNKCGPTNDVFFSNDYVANLKLTFSEEDLKQYSSTPEQWEDLLWSKWTSQCGNFEWIPVNIVYEPGDGSRAWTLNQVGMRMRGSRSRGSNPLGGFKLDYEEFLPKGTDRRLGDMNQFDLLSNENDPSLMVQCMTYQLMRDFGIESPKCNHVRVSVNGQPYGLMESIERCGDSRYLKRHFANPDGPLFGASASSLVCGFSPSMGDLEYKGATFTGDYLKSYEILVGTEADAETTLLPMLKCGDNLQTPNDEDFKACIQDWIKLDEWLKLIAAESLTPTVEDFVGARRNFFLYFEPEAAAPNGGHMRIWGWDYDTALQRQSCYPGPKTTTAPACADPFKDVTSWFGPRGTRANLVQRLTRVFKDQYCTVMKEFLDTVYLPEKVDRMAAVIQPAIGEDPVVQRQAWDWPAEVATMRDFITTHRADMRVVVDSLCAATPGAGTAGAAGAPGAAGASSAVAGAGPATAGAGGATN